LLGAVERVEETGEGLGVGREIVPPGKIPDHFADHVSIAGVLPSVEKVKGSIRNQSSVVSSQ
jgi:hypothetical protein